MTKKRTREQLEREQEKLDLEKEKLGMELDMTKEEEELMAKPLYGENKQKISVGLGTMIIGRILFSKFSRKEKGD